MVQYLEVAGWISLSICSSTSLILMMKLLKRRLTCNYNYSLSTLHFLGTWAFLEILHLAGKINRPSNVPISKRVLLAFLVMMSIVSMNFNLAYNSIGFYQMSKLCAVPYMIVWNFFVKKVRYSWEELLSLCILLCGVALFSISDVELNFTGFIIAAVAVLSTAHNQMYTNQYQKDYQCNGPELQLCIMPIEFSFGLLTSFIFELRTGNSLITQEYTPKLVFLTLGTVFFAIGVNLATFGLIGKTSSITYQVVGHFKTVLLLVLGYIFFPSHFESTSQLVRAIAGIILALFGVFMYTVVKLRIAKKNEEEHQPLLESNKQEPGKNNEKFEENPIVLQSEEQFEIVHEEDANSTN